MRVGIERLAERIGLDVVQRPGHPQTVSLMGELATGLGVRVTGRDAYSWRQRFTFSKVFDELIDGHQIDNEEEADRYMSLLMRGQHIRGLPAGEAGELSHFLADKGMQYYAGVLYGFVGFKHARASVKTVQEYTDVALQEAELFAQFIQLEEPSIAEDWVGRRLFNNWLPSFARAAYMWDTLADLRADGNAQLTRIPPTSGNQLYLARRAFAETVRCRQGVAPVGFEAIVARQGIAKGIRGALAKKHLP